MGGAPTAEHPEPWRRRALLSPVRGAFLLLMGVAELALCALTLIAAHVTFLYLLGTRQVYIPVVLHGRRLPNLARRLARQWSGVAIPVPYQPPPPPPVPDADGLYRDGVRLHRTAQRPTRLRTGRWLLSDDATWRDLAWLLVNPVIGGALAALPVALVGYGGYGVVRSLAGPAPLWYAGLAAHSAGARTGVAALGLALVAAGFAVGPAALAVHARWCAILLGPRRAGGADSATRTAVRHVVAVRRLLALIGLAAAEAVVFVVLLVTLVPFHLLALWPWWPEMLRPARGLANLGRRLAHGWSGVTIPEPYTPPPDPLRPRADGFYRDGDRLYSSPRRPEQVRRWRRVMSDPTTWREKLWLLTDPLVVAVLALPLSLAALYATFALVWPWLWWPVVRPFLAYDPALGWDFLVGLVPGAQPLADLPLLALPVGLVVLVGCAVPAPALLRLHARWSSLLLTPSRVATLTERVRHLTETRTVAAETYAAELRRVERDLHDGTQARLLAIALKVSTLGHLIDHDPGAAKAAAGGVQDAATTALRELRALIAGIHPPMLAERGLADAVRALALDNPLAVQVSVDVPGALDQPTETAAYFSVSELLANATRHSGATTVVISVAHTGGALRIRVEDDGHGGAEIGIGSGLHGIQRRLAPFDGTLALHSPPGGPTVAEIVLPCQVTDDGPATGRPVPRAARRGGDAVTS